MLCFGGKKQGETASLSESRCLTGQAMAPNNCLARANVTASIQQTNNAHKDDGWLGAMYSLKHDDTTSPQHASHPHAWRNASTPQRQCSRNTRLKDGICAAESTAQHVETLISTQHSAEKKRTGFGTQSKLCTQIGTMSRDREHAAHRGREHMKPFAGAQCHGLQCHGRKQISNTFLLNTPIAVLSKTLRALTSRSWTSIVNAAAGPVAPLQPHLLHMTGAGVATSRISQHQPCSRAM
jgi:hypothetical protein